MLIQFAYLESTLLGAIQRLTSQLMEIAGNGGDAPLDAAAGWVETGNMFIRLHLLRL